MSLPATHLQPVQAAVRMVIGPRFVIARALRARGNLGKAVQGVDKTHGPIASVAALSERHWQSQIWRHSWRTYNALKFVIARPRRGRGNLGKAVTISPMAFPRSSRVLRDCHVGLWPPRNDTSGGAVVHRRSRAVEYSPTGRSKKCRRAFARRLPLISVLFPLRQQEDHRHEHGHGFRKHDGEPDAVQLQHERQQRARPRSGTRASAETR